VPAESAGSWNDRELIGRERELGAIAEALAAPGLVTLIGAGGAGKTSLALAVANAAQRRGDAVALVDLAPITDAATLPSVVAAAVGAREADGGDLEGTIAAQLAAEPTLVVLDNLEHLRGAKPFLAWLASHLASSRVLATSRAAIDVHGERVIVVEPLAIPADAESVRTAPAGQLFLRRAGRTAVSLGSDDLVAIAELCARLDGLPLAIELAAAWTSILTPRAMVRRLAAGRVALGDGGPTRHASLERVIESSLELLGDGERRAFDRLAVFAGPFDDDAADAVLDGPALPILRTLASLSLVQVGSDDAGEPRFRLLETVRAVAGRRLDARPAERDDGRLAHARHFHGRAAAAADHLRNQMFGDPHDADVLADRNVGTALGYAMAARDAELAVGLATWPMTLAVRSGLLSEPIARLEAALALGPVPAGLRADALNSLVSGRLARGDDDVVRLAEAAVEAARESRDLRRISRTLVTLGNTASPEAAIPDYEAAADAARAAGYHWMVANAELNLSWRQHQLGRYEASIASSERGLAAAEAADSPITAAMARTSMADAWLALGDDLRAQAAFEAALPILRERAPDQYVTAALTSLMVIALRAADRDRAIDHLAEIVVRLGNTEAVDAINDLGTATALVLADPEPTIAAHGLGILVEAAVPGSYLPHLAQARTRIEERIGAAATARAVEAGRRSGAASVRAEVLRYLDDAGPAARRRIRATYEAFTRREEEVLALLAAGRADPEIAAELGMSAKTASVHVANIKAKLGLSSRVEAALAARRLLDAVNGP
jgi:predicted ATPase/DNA-binding CsgD family transcriptional regulator